MAIMTATPNTGLVVSFKLAGDSNRQIYGAARIKVDGQGGLTVYDARNGSAETLRLSDIQSFVIHPSRYAGKPV
jgi:hypothetical protein